MLGVVLSAVLSLRGRAGGRGPVAALLGLQAGGPRGGPGHGAGQLHGPVPPEDQHHPRLSGGHAGGTCFLAAGGE